MTSNAIKYKANKGVQKRNEAMGRAILQVEAVAKVQSRLYQVNSRMTFMYLQSRRRYLDIAVRIIE